MTKPKLYMAEELDLQWSALGNGISYADMTTCPSSSHASRMVRLTRRLQRLLIHQGHTCTYLPDRSQYTQTIKVELRCRNLELLAS